jgi:hypothetical protein
MDPWLLALSQQRAVKDPQTITSIFFRHGVFQRVENHDPLVEIG